MFLLRRILDKFYPPTQSRSSLDELPDLCLLTVFKYLSLLELLRTIRLVNTRWSGLLPVEMNRRRSLVIVDDRRFDLSRLQLVQYQSHLIEHVKQDDGLTPWVRLPQIDSRNLLNLNNRYRNDDDFHNQVTPEMITTLLDNLPRITSLTVVLKFIDLSQLDQVIRLIDHWSCDLVTLKLTLQEEIGEWLQDRHNTLPDDFDAQMNAQIGALFGSVNSATALKHLKLDLDFFRNHRVAILPPLTVLSRLNSFHSGYLFRHQHLYRVLNRNASGNGQLCEIVTGSTCYKLDLLLRIDRELCGKFVQVVVDDLLTVGGGNDPDDLNSMFRDLSRFCTRFTSLSHLSLRIGNIPLLVLSQSLSQLTQLIHLTMYDYLGFDDENVEHPIIVPVPSVRLMSLTLQTQSHSSTERLHLPEMFPNLQVLSITDNNRFCSTCELYLDEPGPELQQCAQLARRPFRHCPRLHTIKMDANSSYLSYGLCKRLITRDEL